MLKEKRLQTVQATEKTLELLEILANGNEELHIGELADKLQICRNEVLLLLVTLESRGLARWDDRIKIYRPGWKSAELARQFLHLGDASDRAKAGDKMRGTRGQTQLMAQTR